MAKDYQYVWNNSFFIEGETKETISAIQQNKEAAIKLIKEGKNNAYITKQLGISYNELKSILIYYKNILCGME